MIALPIRTDWRRRLLAIGGVLLLVLAVGTYVASRAEAKSSVSQSGMHVLTIYDGGQQKGLLTDANTLREALEQAEIELAATDITEPALDEELVSATYEVNIYRSRPVVIYDESKRTKVMTPYSTPKQIAKQADITLQDEDEVIMEHTTDLLGEGALEKMTINRATAFTLVLYGKKIPSFTKAETVGEMLDEKDITVEKRDTLSVKAGTVIKAGMTVEIWRNGKQTVTEEETIKRPVQEIQDADRKIGYREVRTPGKDGKRNVTYEIVMKNGREVSRKEISSVVIDKPVKEVVVIGAKNNYSGSLNEWLAALRGCESGGNYRTNTGNGFYGAYQFMPATWNSIASKIGRDDLVGVLPSNASPADQDMMIIANTNMTAGLSTQNPGCYRSLGLSNKPPQ